MTTAYIDKDYETKLKQRDEMKAEQGFHLCPKFQDDPGRAHWCQNKGPADGCPDCKNCEME